VLIPTLHLKLGLIKNFIKARDKTEPEFKYILQKLGTIVSANCKNIVWDMFK